MRLRPGDAILPRFMLKTIAPLLLRTTEGDLFCHELNGVYTVLEQCRARFNRLGLFSAGPVLPELANLAELQKLSLDNNQLRGESPITRRYTCMWFPCPR